MKRAVHLGLALIGFVFWAIGTFFYWLSIHVAVLGDKLWPNATDGNCWSYALPRWHKYGGYLMIRNADGQRFLKYFKVWHVIWVKALADLTVRQFVPVKRNVSRWLPWYTVYYQGKVRDAEIPHPAAHGDTQAFEKDK